MSSSNDSSYAGLSEKTSSPISKKFKQTHSSGTDSHTDSLGSDSRAVDPPSDAQKSMYSTTVKRSLHAPNMNSDPSGDAPPRWFVSYFAEFEGRQNKRFVEFEKRLDKRIESLLDEKLCDVSKRVNDHDEKLESIDFEMKNLHVSMKQLKKENEELVGKLDDLENRSRRKNLVVFGIQEKGKKEDCLTTITDFLRFVGGREEDIAQIERSHRTPTHLDESRTLSQPRRIHVGFATYTAKERVRRACVDKLKATKSLYNSHKIFVADDLSKRIQMLRKTKVPIFQRLKKEGKRPFFTYPDRLCYRDMPSGKLIRVNE